MNNTDFKLGYACALIVSTIDRLEQLAAIIKDTNGNLTPAGLQNIADNLKANFETILKDEK